VNNDFCSSYDEFNKIINEYKIEFMFLYNGREYFIFTENNGNIKVYLPDTKKTESFLSADDMLSAYLFDGKRLNDIWENILIESFDYGHWTTINCYGLDRNDYWLFDLLEKWYNKIVQIFRNLKRK